MCACTTFLHLAGLQRSFSDLTDGIEERTQQARAARRAVWQERQEARQSAAAAAAAAAAEAEAAATVEQGADSPLLPPEVSSMDSQRYEQIIKPAAVTAPEADAQHTRDAPGTKR